MSLFKRTFVHQIEGVQVKITKPMFSTWPIRVEWKGKEQVFPTEAPSYIRLRKLPPIGKFYRWRYLTRGVIYSHSDDGQVLLLGLLEQVEPLYVTREVWAQGAHMKLVDALYVTGRRS